MITYFKCLFYIDILLIIGIVVFRSAVEPAFRWSIGARQLVLTLLTPAVGLLAGNVYIFDAYLVAAMAFVSRSRNEVLATYLLMIPMVPALDVQTSAGGIYLLDINTIIAMNFGGFLGIIINKSLRSNPNSRIDIFALLLMCLSMYMACRVDFLNATILGRNLLVVMLAYGAPYFIASRGIRNRDDLDRAIMHFLLAGILCAIIAIFQATRHWVLYEEMNEALHVPLPFGTVTLAIRGGLLRTGGALVDYTAGGMFLACILVIIPTMKSRFRQTWVFGIGAVLLAGLFVTQSRGAWVALAAGWLVCMMYRGYTSRALALAGALSLFPIAVVPLIATFSHRFGETLGASGQSAGTVEYRVRLLQEGVRQVSAHPLFGQTREQLRFAMSDLRQGQHIVDFVNTPLTVALSIGIPGIAAWFLLWGMAIILPWRNRPAWRRRKLIDPAEMPVAMMVVAMVCLVFTSAIDRNLTWPFVALGLLGPCIALRRAFAKPAAGIGPTGSVAKRMPSPVDAGISKSE